VIEMIKLQCPSCGGKLEVGNDLERFACGYCGTAIIVRRSGGTVSLAPVVEGLANVQRGVDRTAAELALSRLERDITKLREEANEALARSQLGLAKTLKSSRIAGLLAVIGLFVLPGACLSSTNESVGLQFFGIACFVGGAIGVVAFNRQSNFIKTERDRAAATRETKLGEAAKEMERYRSMLKN